MCSSANSEKIFTNEDLAYKGNDPGAVKFGNFINYYNFHSPENRLDNLTPEMFPDNQEDFYVCLDIGCNSGDLTKRLHLYLSELFPEKTIVILGIDIDPVLIERANENEHNNITFKTLDVMNESYIEQLNEFLQNYNRKVFDVIFCLSVTMWIHLNHGDEGLVNFLNFIGSKSSCVIVEPQPWRCYRSANKRMKKANSEFPMFQLLKIRENVEESIEKILLNNKNLIKLSESNPSPWNRKIQSFCLKKFKL